MQTIGNYFDNVDRLFLTLTIIIVLTYIIYGITKKMGRPLVIGGIISGMIINALHISDKYFDINSCSGLGNIGITLFMVLLGTQFNYKQLFNRKANFILPLASIVIPFLLGVIITPILIKFGIITPTDKNTTFILTIFIGLAMSMTAFPLLSMFISHSNLLNSKIGHLALFCAAFDEIIFWLAIGTILVILQKNLQLTFYKPIDIFAYIAFIIFIAPRIINSIIKQIKTENAMLGFVIIGCFLSSVLADMVNLHQIFGAFIFGILLPKNNPYLIEINKRISDFVSIVLLPIYFVQAGINTNISLIMEPSILILGIVITLIAILGKFSGAYITGSLLGYSKMESLLLGSLLNIRGAIEVVFLNIGLEMAIINNRLYTILIIMTIITTLMATNVSLWIHKRIKPERLEN